MAAEDVRFGHTGIQFVLFDGVFGVDVLFYGWVLRKGVVLPLRLALVDAVEAILALFGIEIDLTLFQPI